MSPTWVTFGVVTNAAWTLYLAWAELWLGLVATASISVLFAVTFAQLVKLGAPWRKALMLGGLWAVFLAGVLASTGFAAYGITLGLVHIVVVAPGVWTAYRTPDPAGIAPGTWALALSGGVIWFFYGWFYSDAAIVIFAVTTSTASAAVLVRYFATRPSTAPGIS